MSPSDSVAKIVFFLQETITTSHFSSFHHSTSSPKRLFRRDNSIIVIHHCRLAKEKKTRMRPLHAYTIFISKLICSPRLLRIYETHPKFKCNTAAKLNYCYLCNPIVIVQCNGQNTYHNHTLSCGYQSHSICFIWDWQEKSYTKWV